MPGSFRRSLRFLFIHCFSVQTLSFFTRIRQLNVAVEKIIYLLEIPVVWPAHVLWAAQDKLPLKIWGAGWKAMLGSDKTMVQDVFIEKQSQCPRHIERPPDMLIISLGE